MYPHLHTKIRGGRGTRSSLRTSNRRQADREEKQAGRGEQTEGRHRWRVPGMQEEEEAVAVGRSSKAGNQICSLLSNTEITDDLEETLRESVAESSRSR